MTWFPNLSKTFNALPVHGLAIAVIVIAIFLHLIKGTVADQGQMA